MGAGGPFVKRRPSSPPFSPGTNLPLAICHSPLAVSAVERFAKTRQGNDGNARFQPGQTFVHRNYSKTKVVRQYWMEGRVLLIHFLLLYWKFEPAELLNVIYQPTIFTSPNRRDSRGGDWFCEFYRVLCVLRGGKELPSLGLAQVFTRESIVNVSHGNITSSDPTFYVQTTAFWPSLRWNKLFITELGLTPPSNVIYEPRHKRTINRKQKNKL